MPQKTKKQIFHNSAHSPSKLVVIQSEFYLIGPYPSEFTFSTLGLEAFRNKINQGLFNVRLGSKMLDMRSF